MQKQMAIFALSGLLALGAASVPAQDTPAPTDNSQPGRRPGRMDPDRQMKRLTRNLNLTADQQNQIRPLLVDRQQKLQALMQNTSLTPQDRRAQMRTINQNMQSGITAVLNDEQKQKYAQMQEEMKNRMRQRGPAPESAPQP